MKRMPEIAYSGTFFGETLSIAAAIATIEKLERERVPVWLLSLGISVYANVTALIQKARLTEYISLYGPMELNRIRFKNNGVQSLFIQEMAKNGVLIIGSHNTCYAHKKPELDRIISAWDKTLAVIAAGGSLDGGVIQGAAVR